MVQAETSFDVYVAFSDELQRAQAGQLAVLDDDDGLVTRWSIICDQKLQTLSVDLNPDEVEAWTLERNTWQLVQALYAERLSEHRETTPSPQGSTSKNPYTPPLSVVQNIIEANKDLGELSAIRDWLHSIPTSLNPAEIRRGYLPYTKNKLKQAKRTGVKPPRGLAEELDPDAVLRDPTVRLDTEDAAYERAMLRSLFEYVRAGELDLAIDMCRQSDQSWRAASLSGGKLWWDPSLAPGEEGYGDDMETAMEEKRAKGTLNRRLWKRMCRKLAVAPNLDPYERAIYGAISGDTASVLPVCTSWEDHVWTHVNALFEANVEAGLWASAEGRYWSRGAVKSVELGTARLDVEDPLLGSAGRGVSVRTELEDVFDRMLKRGAGDLEDSANDPYHVAQTHLIVGQVDSMLRTFVDRLEQAALETSQETLARLLRFFAHLVLVLRLLKQPLPDEAANLILEAYVNVLEANNENESLIAFYASNLESDSAIESYARFLLTFGTETDLASRRAALLQAHEHGLDLAQIARRTVELILADLSQDLPSMSAHSEFDAYARLDPRQLELIRSLEWLTFDHATYPDALSQANALTRYFLSSDKPHAARELLFRLPDDLLRVVAAAAAPEAGGGEEAASQVREYVDYASLFGCLEKHAKWSGVWAMKPRPGAPKLDVAQFKDGVIKLVDDFYFAAIEIFESEWLKLEPSADVAVPGRLHELSQIRQQLIPHLILRLHTTLYDTRDLIPSNLQRALDLANIVADERYQLYLEFVSDEGNALGVYLEQVRLVSLAAVEGGNPFAVGCGSGGR